MKVVILLYFVASALNYVSSADEVKSIITDSIFDVVGRQIPDFIGDPKDGNLAIPIPDPIHFETQHLELCGPILSISANLTNGALAGLAGYDIVKLDFHSDGARVTVDVDIFFATLQLDAGINVAVFINTWNEIEGYEIHEYYEMEGNIMNALPLAGKGHLHLEATDFRFWTQVIFQVSDHTFIESFENSGFSIKSILSHTEFDGNIDGIFNAMVEELLADHLNRFNRAIATNFGAILKDIINPIL